MRVDSELPGLTINTELGAADKKRKGYDGSGVHLGMPPAGAGLGGLPAMIGEGEFEQPLMMGVLQAITETARDVTEMKQALITSFEGPVQWAYPARAKQFLSAFGDLARQVRGTGVNLGPPKNYAALGLLLAYLEDKQCLADNKEIVKAALRKRGALAKKGETEEIVIRKAVELQDIVLYCQVHIAKARSFINIHFEMSEEGQAIKDLLFAALMVEGKRQYETAPLKPVHRELRTALERAKGKGRGARASASSGGR